MSQTTLDTINLADADLFCKGDPHAAFRLLRGAASVHRNPRATMFIPASGRDVTFGEFWSITKYADIVRVSRDPETFISSPGISLASEDEPSEQQPEDADVPDVDARGRMLIMSDPPRHTKLRQLVNRGFTPRQISRLEGHVHEITNEILDGVAGRDECDFVVDVAAKLPLAVICEMLGIPREDWDFMFDFSNRVLGSADPEYVADSSMEAQMAPFNYFMKLIADRRAEPNQDLVSILIGSEIDGERLDDIDILLFVFLLVVAGNETTRNATSGGMIALIEHPEQRERLLADRSLLPSGIEEILRWVTPVMHMTRHATRDVELGGQQIRKGDTLAMWYSSANRDEDVFPDPYVFDVGRTPNEHLAFGIGQHFCLGANLARLELRVMFEQLLDRYPRIELAGSPERLRSNFIGGIKHMPVRLG